MTCGGSSRPATSSPSRPPTEGCWSVRRSSGSTTRPCFACSTVERSYQPTVAVDLPREVAPGIHWIGDCFEISTPLGEMHSHVSAFLLIGSERTLLVDTGTPAHWQTIKRTLHL